MLPKLLSVLYTTVIVSPACINLKLQLNKQDDLELFTQGHILQARISVYISYAIIIKLVCIITYMFLDITIQR